jgi:hypothetical protein
VIKEELKRLGAMMADRVDELYSDGAIIFLSAWEWKGELDSHSFVRGEDSLVRKCLLETEPDIRLLEACNLAQSEENDRKLQALIDNSSEEFDPELNDLFYEVETKVRENISDDRSPYFGQVLVIVGWIELGIYFHRVISFAGLIQRLVMLYNAGRDSYRKKTLHPEDR